MIYYGSALSGTDARLYDDILAGISSWRNDIPLGRCGIDHAMEMYALVVTDNPQLFYASQAIHATSWGGRVSIQPEYCLSPDEVSRLWGAIDAHVRDYQAIIPSNASDYEKAERAYEYIIKLCEYGLSDNDQNMCSVLVDEVSCCSGYSKAFAFLLSTVDVAAPVINGTIRKYAGSEPHAWNAICIDGRWSWCDVTWGDPVFKSREKRSSEVGYDYLCVPERTLSRSHIPEDIFKKLLPKCDTVGDDWYSRHRLYFERFDPNSISSALQGDVLSREIGFGRDLDGDAYLKFGNRPAFRKAVKRLCDGSEIVGMLEPVYAAYGCRISNFSYSKNDEMLTIHVRYDIVRVP